MASIVALIVLAALAASGEDPTLEDFEWREQHFKNVQEEYFPRARGIGSSISYRALPDTNPTPEYSFVLSYRPKGPEESFEAVVREALGERLRVQVLALHMAHPDASPDRIREQVRVRQTTLAGLACPAIRERIEAFLQLRIPPPRDDLLVIHGIDHQIGAFLPAGDLDFRTKDSAHPVVKWAIETRRKLDECRR
jgi:hypothetical protein